MKQQAAAKATIKTANILRKPSNRINGCTEGEKKKNTAVFNQWGKVKTSLSGTDQWTFAMLMLYFIIK